MYSLCPKFDPRSIDLVTDLDNLRQLFDVVCGKSSPDFRIDIEVIENIVLLTRRSRKNKTYFREFMGYGHEFEKMFTQHPKGIRESGGHYRVIQYTLSGLNIVLRLEADGCLGSEDIEGYNSSISMETYRCSGGSNSVRQETAEKPSNESNIQIICEGYDIPHDSVIELKTCKADKQLSTGRVMPQFWFGQITHLKVGYHRKGMIIMIEEKDLRETGEFQKFENRKNLELKNLIDLIRKIRMMLKASKIFQAVLVYERKSLMLYRHGGGRVLPPDLLSKWNGLSREDGGRISQK